jgi:hypothetical protein
MLDADRREKMKAVIDALPCHVVLPPEWNDFFQRRGPVTPREDDEPRRFVRQHFPTRAIMELATSLAAIPRDYAKYVVLMKDISRQGASFLHVAQLFPGERVELTLATGRIPYTVMRCRRHNDCCYEIGADIA